MAPPKTNIDLYTSGTPNGHKISICFEELGIDYKVHHVDITKNTQKEDWFLKINPNGRIPAIVDNSPPNGGKPQRIFEGGAIMLYLTALYDPENKLSFPQNNPEYWETVEWLTWMQSGLGPMQGQANHFYRYAPEKIPYAINRYQTETKRLYSVLDARLASQEQAGQGLWLVGGKYTIADLACFSWVNWAGWAGIETEKFPALQRWLETIQARDATKKGVDVPTKFELKERMKSKEAEEEYVKHSSSWIIQGQMADQEKHK